MSGWLMLMQNLPCNESSSGINTETDWAEMWWKPFQDVGSNKLLMYIFLVVTIATTIALILLTMDHVGTKENAPHRRIHFSVLFDRNIRRVFRSQKEECLNTMLHGVRSALSCHCERPPVIMFLATPTSQSTAMAIARRLTQAFLVAKGMEISSNELKKIVIKGSKYQSLEDYWDFFRGVSKRLAQLKVAIVAEFQRLHPQVALVLCNLADDAFSPYPKTMILLMVDVDNYFTDRELEWRSSMELAEAFTSHITSGFLDQDAVADLQRTICARPALILPDQHLELK